MNAKKYKYIILFFLLMVSHCVMAQQLKKMSPAKAKSIISTIVQRSKAIVVMTADFVQKSNFSFMDEPVVSYGSMTFNAPSKLEWLYSKPYKYAITIDDSKVTTKSGKHVSTLDLSANRIFKSISKMAFSSINGESFANSRDFNVTMYTRGKYWVGILVPRSETMKKRLKKVMIEYNPAIHNIQKINMIQSNGDNIAIEFKNIKASSRKNIK
jgi:outer membrane lipoprotein-sorting protein